MTVYMIRRKSDRAFKLRHSYGNKWTTKKNSGAVYHMLGYALAAAKNSIRYHKMEPTDIEIVEFSFTEVSTLQMELRLSDLRYHHALRKEDSQTSDTSSQQSDLRNQIG